MLSFYRNLSLKNKLSSLVIAIVIVFFLIIFWTSSTQLQNNLARDLENELRSVGILTTETLNAEEIQALTTKNGADDPTFLKMQKYMDGIMQKQKVMSWIYAWSLKGDEVRTIAYTTNLNEIYKPGEVFKDLAPIHLEAAKKAMAGGEAVVTDIFEDPFGKWRTVFTPVKDKSGNNIAVIGIDYSADYIQATINKAGLTSLIIAVIGVLVVAVVIYLAVMLMTKPLRRLVEVANEVADGNLSNQVELYSGKDEIGELSKAIQTMHMNLRNLIHNIGSTSEHMASSSEELAASSEETKIYSRKVSKEITDVAEITGVSMKITEEAVVVLEETSRGIQRIAESTSTVSEESVDMAKEAETGNEAIVNVSAQMSSIDRSVAEITKAIEQLDRQMTEIDAMSNLISQIAEQTNLLALNAAIEAARAGDQGKGFAVVAQEVRKLAEGSRDSAKQISDMIGEIQTIVQSSVALAQTGQKEVKTGLELTEVVSSAFGRILEATNNVASQIQEISAASEEISASSEQVTASVNELKGTSGRISVKADEVAGSAKEQLLFVEEVAKASESISSTALQLQDLIQKFKV